MNGDFLHLVETELAAIQERHQEPMPRAKDYCGAIRLGAIRLFNAVETQGDRREILDELVQIAATCYQAAEDLQLLPCNKMVESDLEYKGEKLSFDCDHKGLRFRADDPNQQKLGMAISYKCLHGVEWVITAPCIEGLGVEQFETSCGCDLEKEKAKRRMEAELSKTLQFDGSYK